jgi:hypothetical protein
VHAEDVCVLKAIASQRGAPTVSGTHRADPVLTRQLHQLRVSHDLTVRQLSAHRHVSWLGDDAHMQRLQLDVFFVHSSGRVSSA